MLKLIRYVCYNQFQEKLNMSRINLITPYSKINCNLILRFEKGKYCVYITGRKGESPQEPKLKPDKIQAMKRMEA